MYIYMYIYTHYYVYILTDLYYICINFYLSIYLSIDTYMGGHSLQPSWHFNSPKYGTLTNPAATRLCAPWCCEHPVVMDDHDD